jgi:hypothetical protein
LRELGLVVNSGAGQAHGAANAWRLDHAGAQLMQSVGRRSSTGSSSPDRAERAARE